MSNSPTDKPPEPPEKPGPNECCEGGCSPCIYDIYQDKFNQYRKEMKDWEARQ